VDPGTAFGSFTAELGHERSFSCRKPNRIPLAEPHPATAHVSQGRCPEASSMPRPMTVLAGERQQRLRRAAGRSDRAERSCQCVSQYAGNRDL
jgi:hypothetical protein